MPLSAQRSEADADGPALSHDEAFDLLSSSRRRFVLHRLQEEPEGVELGDLATELAARENDVPPDELSSKERKRIYVSLYQTHVPKLEDGGVVTYDGDTGVVRPTDRLESLAAYVASNGPADDWAPLYLLVAGAGLAGYGLARVVDGQVVAPGTVLLLTLVAVALLALAHVVRVRALPRNASTIPVGSD